MKKRILAAMIAAATVLSLAGCKDDTTSGNSGNSGSSSNAGSGDSGNASGDNSGASDFQYTTSNDGKKLVIAVWNDEWAEFFETFVREKLPADLEVQYVQKTNDNRAYQLELLDQKLPGNVDASADDKIDLFLAEADYIKKYAWSNLTVPIDQVGITDTSNCYAYTLDAAKDQNGAIKGITYQACPSGMIIRRSIAQDVLGTDDPDELQSKLDTWDKFEEVAKQCKDKGYYMTGSALETYRAFANNSNQSYLSADNKFAPTDAFNTWFEQAQKFVDNGYTIKTSGLWDPEKNAQMGKDGKMFCCFGPTWYYNFSMTTAMQETPGDWVLIPGPAPHFWGGTWMMCANGTDNVEAVKIIMDTMINDEDVVTKITDGHNIKEMANEAFTGKNDKYNPQFPNNKKVAEKFANNADYGNDLLGGQNDIAVLAKFADQIKWDSSLHTELDQTFNETLPNDMQEYFAGKQATVDDAWNKFYTDLGTVDPTITH